MAFHRDLAVTVWWARLGDLRPGHVDLLDPVERRRRAEYRRAPDRDRFTIGAALCRAVLGAHLQIPPARVPLSRSCESCPRPHGRPRLPWADGPTVSVSHSQDLVVVALAPTRGLRVGVDVEPVAAAPAAADLDVFSRAEHLLSAPLGHDHRAALALRAWVRKEAVLKATGDGLRVRMSELTVLHGDGTVRVDWPGRPACERIHVRDLSWPGPTHAASLALVDAPAADLAVVEHDAGPLLADLSRGPGHRGSAAPMRASEPQDLES